MSYSSWDYMNDSLYALEAGQRRAASDSMQTRYDNQAIKDQLNDLAEDTRSQGRDLSYLRKVSEEGFKIIANNTFDLLQVSKQGFNNLADALEKQQQTLGSIDEALRNPKAIAAGEKFRLGLELLRNELLEEAEIAFRESIEQDNLQPMAHLALGMVLSLLENRIEARQEFLKSARYAAVKRDVVVHETKYGLFRPVPLMLAAGSSETDEEVQETLNLINKCYADESTKDRQCSELTLTMVRLMYRLGQNTDDMLLYTLRLNPSLAVVAVWENLPRAREFADQVYGEKSVQAAIKLQEIEDKIHWGDKSFSELNSHVIEAQEANEANPLGRPETILNRQDVALYEDITYTLVNYESILRGVGVNTWSFRDTIKTHYDRDLVSNSQDRMIQLQTEISQSIEREREINAELNPKTKRFGKKEPYKWVNTDSLLKELDRLQTKREENEQELSRREENFNSLQRQQSENQTKRKLMEEWVQLAPQALTGNYKAFRLL